MNLHFLTSTLRLLPRVVLLVTILVAIVLPSLASAQSNPDAEGERVFLPLVVGGQSTDQFVQAAATSELFISEYIEGSGFNKAIEIYNGTGAAVNLATGGYTLELYSNGSAIASQSMALSGMIANGDVYVVARADADPVIVAQADAFGPAVINFNGDDAVVLRKNGVIVDAFGQIGNDPGTEWGTGLTSTADNTLRRKSSVCAGDTNGTDTFDPTIEWNGFANNTLDGFGVHTASCDVGVILSVNDVAQSEGDSGTTVFAFTVSLSAPAGASGVTFDITTADGTAQDDNPVTEDNDYVAQTLTGQTISANNSQYTFNVTVHGDTTSEPDETFLVNVTNVTGATVGDGQGQGTITNDDIALLLIHDIQGNGATVTPGAFTVEAIVVGDYQTQGSGQLRGFFIQEEDVDADADPNTSEGIFVFCETCPTPVSAGDKVRVTGASSDFFGMSQLSATTAASISVLGSGNPLPTPATVELPVPNVPSGDLAAATMVINAYFETFEGMLVTFPDTLSVSEYFELARYGQVILSEGGRPRTFTDANMPSAAGLIDHEIGLARRTIILDDTDNRQNRPVDVPNTPYYHPVPGLSIGNFFRGGDTITHLTGVLHWSFAGQTGTDAWRIRPVTEAYSYAFTPVNLRLAAPSVGGSLKVASFNVLNYFLTVDTTSSNNVGNCGASGTLDCRGADSVQELERQRAKLTQALLGLDADVVGLIEMENTPDVTPQQQIVDDLNAIAGAGTYAYIDTGVIGTDAIKVSLIYKPSEVTPIGAPMIDNTPIHNRPPLAQTFAQGTARFTVILNHFKSKGCDGATGSDADQGDGQGCFNAQRVLQAEAILSFINTTVIPSASDPDVLIIGDLNSYAKEDPIVALNAGYIDLVAAFGGTSAYSYVFDGQLGYLDHALANTSLKPQVTNVAEWHINADEIPLFDYNDEVRDGGEATFEEESDVLPLYAADAFRTSDHDPVVIGLNLNASPNCANARPSSVTLWPPNHQFVPITVLGVVDPEGDPLSMRIDTIFQDEPVNASDSGNTSPDGQGVGTATAQVRAERVGSGNGRVYHIRFTAKDGYGGTCSGEVLVGVPQARQRPPVDDGALYNSTVSVVGAAEANKNVEAESQATTMIFLPLVRQ